MDFLGIGVGQEAVRGIHPQGRVRIPIVDVVESGVEHRHEVRCRQIPFPSRGETTKQIPLVLHRQCRIESGVEHRHEVRHHQIPIVPLVLQGCQQLLQDVGSWAKIIIIIIIIIIILLLAIVISKCCLKTRRPNSHQVAVVLIWVVVALPVVLPWAVGAGIQCIYV